MIPNKYQTVNQNLINYSFTDVAQNLGYITYYAAKIHDGTNPAYILTTTTNIGSNDAWSSKLSGSGAIMTDIEFTTTLNAPLLIKGKAYVSVPCNISGSNSNTITVTATLYINGSQIDTATVTDCTTAAGGGSTTVDKQIIGIYLDCGTQTLKSGNSLTLKISGTLNGTGSPNGYIGHDPMGRTMGNVSSALKLMIPIKVMP